MTPQALTLVRPIIETPVPLVFERALASVLEGGSAGLPGYQQPDVIVERLALVAPRTLHTRFYTSAYTAQPGFRPVGPKRFVFPNSYSLLELVEDLHRKLSAVGLENKLVPSNIDEKAEFAAIQHQLQNEPDFAWYENTFRPTFLATFDAMVHHYGAVEITRR